MNANAGSCGHNYDFPVSRTIMCSGKCGDWCVQHLEVARARGRAGALVVYYINIYVSLC